MSDVTFTHVMESYEGAGMTYLWESCVCQNHQAVVWYLNGYILSTLPVGKADSYSTTRLNFSYELMFLAGKLIYVHTYVHLYNTYVYE